MKRFLLLTVAAAACTSSSGVPMRPAPSGIERSDRVAYYAVQEVLGRADVQGHDALVICLAQGRDGSGIPHPLLLEGLGMTDSRVKAPTACERVVGVRGSSPQILTTSGEAALFLSIMEVDPMPGSPTARIRFEASDQEPVHLDCLLRESAVRVVMRGRPPPGPPPERLPSVSCRSF